jgi:hypothetical protein
LCDYIEARNADEIPELIDWTVLLVSNTTADADETREIAGRSIGLVTRAQWPSPGVGEVVSASRYSIRRLLSPTDEMVDIGEEQKAVALEMTKLAWAESTRKDKRETPPTVPSGISIRRERNPEMGLIMIYPLNPATVTTKGGSFITGFAISFPDSDRAEPVDYQVNNVYWAQEFDFMDDKGQSE